MGAGFPVILDAAVILLLAGTIFYAIRLSMHIQAFRDSRKDMEKLLGDLAAHIEKAERAIEGLRENARQSGRDLQAHINEAQSLSEELQIMSQSGNRLASRLEKLADKNARAPARPSYKPDLAGDKPRSLEAIPSNNSGEPFSGFAIHDREFEEGMDESGFLPGDFEEEETEEFGSRAERELFEALQKKNKAKTGAGGVS